MSDRDPALLRAIEQFGGNTALAEAMQITPGALSQWQRTPVERVLTVERLTGVPRHELRPDIYPPADAA